MNKKLVFILVGVLVCIAIVGGIVLVSLKGNKENANTQDNEQKIEADGSKDSKEDNNSKVELDNTTDSNKDNEPKASLDSIPMDSKNAEYNKIKEKAKVLKCTKTADEYGPSTELEILYSADGFTAKGVHKYVIVNVDNGEDIESRKKTLESNLKSELWEYYNVQIVDNHIEYEIVSTDTIKLMNDPVYQKDFNWSKDHFEKRGYTCTVTNNYLN